MELPDNIFILLLVFGLGLAVLIKGSDFFIEGASQIAQYYKVPDIIIGLTLVSIGTSLPELATNLYSAYNGNVGVAMGNVTGSNVANVMLVLGLAIFLMKKIPIDRIVFHRDTMIMGCCYLLFVVLMNVPFSGKEEISQIEGGILFIGFLSYMAYLFKNLEKLKALKIIANKQSAARSATEQASSWLIWPRFSKPNMLFAKNDNS